MSSSPGGVGSPRGPAALESSSIPDVHLDEDAPPPDDPPKKTVKKSPSTKPHTKARPLKTLKVEIGPPTLTRFERARIIGARALQLSLGAPPFIPLEPGVRDPIRLATRELEARALPLSIRRVLPDGRSQDIPIQSLL